MLTLKTRIARLENDLDNALEQFVFHHRHWGVCLVFLGLPLVTLLIVVCLCSALIALPIALAFGWM